MVEPFLVTKIMSTITILYEVIIMERAMFMIVMMMMMIMNYDDDKDDDYDNDDVDGNMSY